ncbi:MAG TPA: hypothetical protein VFW96_02355, partial [Thermomicrobiales bacterium]|nr:hypothetical protein [Thermomicrobiales bacterium]
LLHIAWLYWSSEWRVRQQHAGIVIVEQVRGQPIAELARILHAFVTSNNVVLANALYEWKPPTGWAQFRQ